ncbi:hypothetical protein N7535_006418 [Penicillium sp. DV-2018c]|nr:hypothetical protein N7535_006418 [Penicillium sp. DV-2018c]
MEPTGYKQSLNAAAITAHNTNREPFPFDRAESRAKHALHGAQSSEPRLQTQTNTRHPTLCRSSASQIRSKPHHQEPSRLHSHALQQRQQQQQQFKIPINYAEPDPADDPCFGIGFGREDEGLAAEAGSRS